MADDPDPDPSGRNSHHEHLGQSCAQYWTGSFRGRLALQQLWLFIVAPFIGAAIAAAVYGAIRVPAELITTPQAERALASQQEERGEENLNRFGLVRSRRQSEGRQA